MDLKGSEVHRNLTGSNILKSLSSISPHFLKNITRDELQIENKHITLNHTLEKAVKQIDKGNNKNNSQKR
jgi:thermostable 8-oxoguanine DNA glycosylase